MNANNGLVARGFGKTFAGRTVLSGVDLTIRPGEVRALLGHNGSGKSTFVKLLAGVHPPDPGATLTLGGEPVVLPYPGERPPDRLRFVHQDLGLVGTLSGTENFALGRGFRLRRDGSIDWRAERAFARAHLQAFDPSIDPDVPVSELTPAQRSVIAIARAVQDADDSWSALVLDEPTAALPLEEAARLYEVIRTLSARGTSILLVTHRLDEVLDLCDTATVLRDGRVAADVHVGDLDKRSLIELIVGGPTDDVFARAATRDGDVVLDVRDVTGTSLRAFDLTVRAGEVVGVAGLTGSGREEIVPLLSQDVAPRAGSVRIHGREIAGGGARRAIRAGVGSVPADRLGKAAIGAFTVRENITLPRLSDLLRPASGGGTIDADRERTDVLGWIAETAVRPADPEIPFARLSGGNQQKAVLARWLRYRPDVLLIDEPTQGVDVGAKHQIYELLARAAEDGMAVVIASTDDDELARIAQRVVVLVDGRVHDELSGDRLSVNALARASLGDAPSSPHDPLGRKAS